MRTGKSNREEDEFEEDEFISKKDGPSSTTIANINSDSKDAKNNDKANAIRSKHSVTEQRRRSKINERFQMLRDLIPHSDQKRDTASFLLEVIEYVRYLQEKVQKCEGSYRSSDGEPTKLMPWRNSHWRAQSFAGQSPTVKNGLVPGLTFPAKFDETQNLEDSLSNRDLVRQGDGANIGTPLQVSIPSSTRSDGILARSLQASASNVQSTECLVPSETLNQHDEVTIEGGTISISSLYSEGLLNTLTHALNGAGVNLSQASISIQIDIGKRAAGASGFKDHGSNEEKMQTKDRGSPEDSNHSVKRLKT